MKQRYMTGSYCEECESRVKDLTAHLRFRHDLTAGEYQEKYPNAEMRVKECVVCGDKFAYKKYLPPRKTCSDECHYELKSITDQEKADTVAKV